MNCDDFSRELRLNKLTMARDVDAEILATACPKCRIHLRCYTANEYVQPRMNIDVEDITVLAAKALGLQGNGRWKK
jgi:Fe-S oxidoreductase